MQGNLTQTWHETIHRVATNLALDFHLTLYPVWYEEQTNWYENMQGDLTQSWH